MKFERVCAYEKVYRTPLTRKYLSDVEKELARTKARLARYENESEDGEHDTAIEINPNVHAPAVEPETAAETSPTDATNQAIAGLVQFSNHVAIHTPVQNDSPTFRAYQNGSQSQSYVQRPANPTTQAETSPAFSLETPPASGDFDWDERMTRTLDGKYPDGMASLTERSSRGYMGVASGAALLRLADNSNDDSNEDPELHFQDDSRQLPMPAAMSFSPSQLEPFVDAYFQVYHVLYPIVHEATFRAQFMDIIPQPKNNAWQVLLHIMAAIGAFASSETTPVVDEALFEAAKARLSIDMLETGNLTLVQAFTLISNYVQKRNKPNSGYNYLGIAKRMAMGIGLHKEFPTWRSKPLMLEIRRRVWWCLYVFDVGAVITFSRPLDFPTNGIEVELPLNVHDGDITPSTKEFPPEAQATTLYTHVRCQSRFHLATEAIYRRLISTPYPTADEMLELDNSHLGARYQASLPHWYQEGAEQPTRFRLSHAIMQWRCQNFRILMYRAFLMRRFFLRSQSAIRGNNNHHLSTDTENRAMQRCLDTSAHTIQSITYFWRQNKQNVVTCWYSLYFLFQAILIPVICLRNEPDSPAARGWRDQICNTLEVLDQMTHMNPAAARCHTAITNLCGPYLAHDITQWNSPIHESPQTQLNGLYSFMWPMTDAQNAMPFDLALHESATHDIFNQLGGF